MVNHPLNSDHFQQKWSAGGHLFSGIPLTRSSFPPLPFCILSSRAKFQQLKKRGKDAVPFYGSFFTFSAQISQGIIVHNIL